MKIDQGLMVLIYIYLELELPPHYLYFGLEIVHPSWCLNIQSRKAQDQFNGYENDCQRIICYEEQTFISGQNINSFYSSLNVWIDSTISPCNDNFDIFP